MATPQAQLNNRYQILREHGQGGMGKVFLAEDLVLGRRVAIKTIRVPDAVKAQEQQWLRDRFIHEARVVARFSHPAIVTLYDIFEHAGGLYIVMEYVDGRSLADVLEENPVLLQQREFMLRVLRQTAAGLDYAHSNQVIHRDIKPANLLIDRGGATKITDFGIAKLTGATTMTTTGMLIGTVDYMSPEQIKGEPLDGRADQFSLAVVVYGMLTGKKVFSAESFVSLSYKICHETPLPPSAHNPEVPHGVDAVLAKGLAKEPALRFSSCGEFIEALASELAAPSRPTLAEQPAAAYQRPATVIEKTAPIAENDAPLPPVKRGFRPWANVPLMVVLVASVAAAGVYFVSSLSSHGGSTGPSAGTASPPAPAHPSPGNPPAPNPPVATPGRILGFVKDPSGAAMEGARVELFKQGKMQPLTETSTNDAGQFSFLGLDAGKYRIAIDKPGFHHNERFYIAVASGTETRLDIPMMAQAAAQQQQPRSNPGPPPNNPNVSPPSTTATASPPPDRANAAPPSTTRANPSPPPAPQRIRVGGTVQGANLIRKVDPVYPQIAKQARVQGTVRFTGVIAKDGSIESLQLISGHPLLVQAAEDAVKQWLYRPTMLNGEPVEVITEIDVNFTLTM